jgi:2',3'-cyclic-nucleotide 2'-phosphodiesterase (5'-nucleotidase family)
MLRYFSYTLLITCVLVFCSCKTYYTQVSFETNNFSVSDSLNGLDYEIVKIIQPYKEFIENDINRVISVSEIEMEKNKPESLLTNFLADLLLAEGQKSAKENNLDILPVISYFNYGGIRTFFPAGEITVGKIFELMPFENEMVFIRLSGEQIIEFINIIAEKGGDSVGGATFVISGGKAKNIMVGNEMPYPRKYYWMVTNDYVAGGGDNLTVLANHYKLINSGKKIRDVIISNLESKYAKGEKISAKLDGRIRNE